MNRLGKLLIIGFGPGAMEHITGRALAALEESEAVIGYSTYVDLVRPLMRHQEIVGTGMTEEVSRAREAVRRAEDGQTIAVISSGDAGVYGMAGLVYEVLIERGWKPDTGVVVEVIPGISAIQSCSSLLGAPIMHDSCTISLSDHLTPWESIAARVEAAGMADFVIAFYNPRSGKRTRQIEEARQILLRYRDPATPVGIVKSAYRDRQQTIVTTLQDMLNHEIGMLSTVIVGNSATIVYEGLLVTPRGYERKYCLGADTQVLKPHERLRTAAEPWSLAALAGGDQESGIQSEPVLLQNPEGASRKPAVLLVGHGSRVEEGNEELRNFTRLLADRRPEYIMETCFIELSAPSISEGIDLCVRGGAVKVYVVPIILFAAGHSKLDIPMALDQAKLKYPDVEFIYGRPIGVQERAAEILLDRIAGAMALSRPIQTSEQWAQSGDITNNAIVRAHQSHFAHPDSSNQETAAVLSEEKDQITDEDTIVLVMGRGGSDPDANSDLFKLTRLLWERTSFKSVEACFIAMAKPSLNAGLERCLALGARKIIVLPYLLFTGVLMRQFNETVNGFAAAHPEIEVEAGSYLGTHPLLSDMLIDRIDETVAGLTVANCDNCKYRDEASIHHHHHHHGDEAHHHGSHGGEGHGCGHEPANCSNGALTR
ncbi:precorrin-3B C(17)-methyltransferase [Paenibacillus sp. sgz5001063]|uniref:precorrin-3B C(17)-methyltransferase n=1 Tax=Paenibacillus sp. sgz5001063 TaxID=3242474 RepID=UPI0036D22EC9